MTLSEPSRHNPIPRVRKILEVIVTSVEEAREAAAGGADRLEIVRSLDQGGLTPSLPVVEQILSAVPLPARVMLREANSMTVANGEELFRLVTLAKSFSRLPAEGLVLGFIQEGAIDTAALSAILAEIPQHRVTFHRAFEHVDAPLAALGVLKNFRQIDRILVRVGEDGSAIDLPALKTWQHFAATQIQFVAGIGLSRELLPRLQAEPGLNEIHVGRSVREPENVSGAVSRAKVAAIKSAFP